MKKLLGIDKDQLIIQDDSKIYLEKGNKEEYKNVDLILNRNEYIQSPFKDEVAGEGVFDFRYGPVTGGVGEAGVYHLYTYGERILFVKIDTSYKRREIDSSITGKDILEGLKLSQSICGNFSVSHSLAFVRAVENAMNLNVNQNVKRIRAVALELERIYNHLYVISGLAASAAQQVLASHLQGLFEDSLETNKIFFGSRYLKNVNKIGGVRLSVSNRNLDSVKKRLNKLIKEFDLLFKNSMKSGNYIDRLHSTAILSETLASQIGLTGPSLRACNVSEDLRKNEEIYKGLKIIKDEEGDSLSRMEVRAGEIFESANFILNQLDKIQNEPEKDDIQVNGGEGLGWSESPSGSVVYNLKIEDSKIKSIYISVPSVFGFAAISESMVGNIFTDFPFAVKSYGVNFADAAR